MVFQIIPLLAKILISVAIQAIGYAMTSRSTSETSQKFESMASPTAEEGAPIPVLFGEMWIESPNVLWSGDKETNKRKIKT